jgi:hypothetical protein
MHWRIWTPPVAVLLLAAWMVGGGFGCSGDKPSNPGNGGDIGDTEGRYLITGTFQNLLLGEGSIEFIVTRMEDNDASAKNLDLAINGIDIPLRTLLSTDEVATFALESFGYTVGQSYTVTATLSGKTATCTFTAPFCDYPTITAPPDDGLFTPGEALDVSWTFDSDSGDPDQIFLRASPVTEEDETYYETELSGSLRSHSIPGTETATWTDAEVLITVDLGEKAWAFTGALVYVGSALGTVLPGDAVTVRNSHGQVGSDYEMQLTIYPTSLDADGTSSAELNVSIFDQNSQPCPDGTVVSVTASPAGRVTLSPAAPVTSGGTVSISVTAGTTTGAVAFTVTTPYLDTELSASTSLTLTEASGSDYQIAVGSGTGPVISWTPADGMASLAVTQAALTMEDAAWSISRRVVGGSWITPPVTYGSTPAGAAQLIPPSGNAPALTPGTAYKVWLVTQTGEVYSETFTP